MLKIICDRCNKTESFSGVVSNQFKYGKNFEELTKTHQTSDMVDLCKKCFKEYTDAYNHLERQRRESILDQAKRLVFGSSK